MFIHVSGGSELTLKPALNIIGGMQPRAFSEPIPCMLHIDVMLGIGAILDMMGELEVICIGASVVDIAFIVASPDMLDPPMSILLFIPVMLIEGVSREIPDDPLHAVDEESSPKPVPA